jgi:transposase
MVSYEFDLAKGRLDIELDFYPSSTFGCPECNAEGCRVHCKKCAVKLVNVPWGRTGSGFTLLFGAMVMVLAKEISVKAMSKIVKEHDTRLWRILNHYVQEARRKADSSSITGVGVDETSSKRGHNYVTLFVDIVEPRTIQKSIMESWRPSIV